MKATLQQKSLPIINQSTNEKKFSGYLLKPLKAGIIGFSTILAVIFFINSFSYVLGMNEKFGMDYLDLLLAGVGFFLQMTHTLLQSFYK